MVTPFPANINDNARTTRLLLCLDSSESSLGHTCLARVFGIRRADFFSVFGVGSGVCPGSDAPGEFELLQRYAVVVFGFCIGKLCHLRTFHSLTDRGVCAESVPKHETARVARPACRDQKTSLERVLSELLRMILLQRCRNDIFE